MRVFLGAEGRKRGGLSKFVEEAVRWRIFHQTVREARAGDVAVGFNRPALCWLAGVAPSLARRTSAIIHDFGRGRHAAGLNFGDCFAYALAKITGEPLLFKGEDFKKTDIVSAL